MFVFFNKELLFFCNDFKNFVKDEFFSQKHIFDTP